jgi:hypothetical protein
MRRFWQYGATMLVAMLLLTACEVPVGVMSRKKMAEVLADVHIAEAVTGQTYAYNDFSSKRACFEKVFEKHDITRDEFNHSVDWYARHPRIYSEVYEETVKLIEKRQDEVKNYAFHPEENPEFRHVIDSLNIWLRPMALRTTAEKYDSLHFEIADSTLFGVGEKYIWTFEQRAERDSLTPTAYLKLFVDYEHGHADSIIYRLNDSLATYRYRVRLETTDTLKINRLHGYFLTTNSDTVPPVRIDSVRLWRYYNTENVQIDSTLRQRLDSIHAIEIKSDTISSEKSKKSKAKSEKIERKSIPLPTQNLRHQQPMHNLRKNEKNSGK